MKWFAKHRWWKLGGLVLLAMLLLLIDRACYQVTVPVTLEVRNQTLTVDVDGTRMKVGAIGTPRFLWFANISPVIHEYQIDGTDSTNNFTLNQTYFEQLASSPYYRFQAWMRDLDGTSAWRNVQIAQSKHIVQTISQPTSATSIPLPAATSFDVHLQLQRPETPRTVNVIMDDHTSISITLDRNDRYIRITRTPKDFGEATEVGRAFFPQDPWPFAAMVISFLARTCLWALAILAVVLLGDALSAGLWHGSIGRWLAVRRRRKPEFEGAVPDLPDQGHGPLRRGWEALTAAIHPSALLFLAASLGFVLWIAKVQYHGLPHIYDASAYFFAAKIYAHGQLAAPLPAVANLFPGPFILQFGGKWFAQYPPGTALTLMPGMWLGLPWAIEPICGTLALLGCGLVLARLYGRSIATLAIILGTLSPFYSYLAASYLSHTIALFYLVWGWWALLRFMQDKGSQWYLYLAVVCFGLGALTRDLVGVLWIALVVGGCIVLGWGRIRRNWRNWLKPTLVALGLVLCFGAFSLYYNFYLTHDALVSPRTLFYAPDRWGFGMGIGFYGQHTLAAGLVNLDELLTSLATDLYGWPFYLTLAFVPLPFITGRARLVDWILLVCLIIMSCACMGYFYHGIYLGPRYLFETLPFLLGLTTRGILTLGTLGMQTGALISSYLDRVRQKQPSSIPGPWSLTTGLLIVCLLACNLLYYLPRQTVVYQDYTSLPPNYKVDLNTIYHPKLHQAIVVTSDFLFYELVLFPLNDPDLHGDVIYALASDPTQYAQLQAAFPGRTIYQLNIRNNGSVRYETVDNP
ncbi:ArnT family glycosyltransferase [Dictyobacter formicarum]|uniref:Glycosyltransferase RgtA/B/C/D-like domain-containing protein n=1 Tax=Dictyobacter formicarum TaxID=2778368 RepID=A0ABQ3VWH9_9CHLR|nr:glycosyltransferase family 39 protein [Dictyobacter formicarum]GHO89651.1 hypothetical protein KSZ_76570 [Dictyobacter formicarum]